MSELANGSLQFGIVQNCGYNCNKSKNDQKINYVILGEIRVIALNAIVQNRNDDSFAGIAFTPSRYNIHVEAFLTSTVLFSKRNKKKGKNVNQAKQLSGLHNEIAIINESSFCSIWGP